MTTKFEFMREIKILIDTRERKNSHITNFFDTHNIQYTPRRFEVGDYSFIYSGVDYSLSCIIERKNGVDELWGNLTRDKVRFNTELCEGANMSNFTLLIENVKDWTELKAYKVSDNNMKRYNRRVQNIGEIVCNKIQALQYRHKFNILFTPDIQYTGRDMLRIFYSFYLRREENAKHLVFGT